MAVSSQCISFYPFVPWDRLEQKRALLVSALSLRILLNVSFQNPLHPPGGRSRPHEGSTPGFRHFPTMVPDSYLFRAVDPFPPLSTPLLFPMNPTRTRTQASLTKKPWQATDTTPPTVRKLHNKENSTNCQNTERPPQTQQYKQDKKIEEYPAGKGTG